MFPVDSGFRAAYTRTKQSRLNFNSRSRSSGILFERVFLVRALVPVGIHYAQAAVTNSSQVRLSPASAWRQCGALGLVLHDTFKEALMFKRSLVRNMISYCSFALAITLVTTPATAQKPSGNQHEFKHHIVMVPDVIELAGVMATRILPNSENPSRPLEFCPEGPSGPPRNLETLEHGAGMLSSTQGIGKNANPGILPPNASYGGMTYGEWSAHYYYQGLLSSCSSTPGLCQSQPPADGNFNPKNVLFLPLKEGSDLTTDHFDVDVPVGKAVMVMVFGFTTTTNGPLIPGYYEDSNWLEADLAWVQALAESGALSCTIDGIPVQNLKDYVVSGTLPGTVDMNFGDPYPPGVPIDSAIVCSLLLRSLAPGHHTIDVDWWGERFLTYNITIKP